MISYCSACGGKMRPFADTPHRFTWKCSDCGHCVTQRKRSKAGDVMTQQEQSPVTTADPGYVIECLMSGSCPVCDSHHVRNSVSWGVRVWRCYVCGLTVAVTTFQQPQQQRT